MSRRLLVLGAAGFIGRRIVAALSASGATVRAGVRRPCANFPDGVATVLVDATSESSLAQALADADAVVNCIAGDAATIVANAAALKAVLTRRATPMRCVHLSSMAVYGAATGRIDETAAWPAALDDYGSAKQQAERLLADVADRVVLRPGIVYGPDSLQWSGLIGDLVQARRLGHLGEAGEGRCNLVHVDDVAAAVRLALERPAAAGRSYHLGVDPAPTWNAYFAQYGEALGLKPVPAISPLRLACELRLAGPLLKIAGLLVGADRLPPPIRPWLTRLCRHDIQLDGRRSAAELGLAQRSLGAGLAETAAWHRSSRRQAPVAPDAR